MIKKKFYLLTWKTRKNFFVVDPPTVKTIPEDGFLEVRKGEYVDIGCETTGTPTPIVNWRKNVSVFVNFVCNV